MAETQTPNYKWTKPDIGGDSSNWGNVLNATIDAVDSVVWANQQAGLPIGSVAMFAGATAPVNWLICDGSSLATTGTYAGLFGIIGYTYGGSGANFNLPNLVQNFPLGAGANPIGTTGGTFSYTLSVANMPPHTHYIEQTPHSHSAYQNAHSHVIATGGHNHTSTTGSHRTPCDIWEAVVNIQPGSGGNMSNTGKHRRGWNLASRLTPRQSRRQHRHATAGGRGQRQLRQHQQQRD